MTVSQYHMGKHSFPSACRSVALETVLWLCVVDPRENLCWMQKTQRLMTHCALLPAPPNPMLFLSAPSTSQQDATTSRAHRIPLRIVKTFLLKIHLDSATFGTVGVNLRTSVRLSPGYFVYYIEMRP